MNDLPATGAKPQGGRVVYRLMLFVAGEEPNSILAHQNLVAFCRAELSGRYELQVINVFEEFDLALAHRVLVTPCLVMLEPPPRVMIAGTLQDASKMRTALRLNKE